MKFINKNKESGKIYGFIGQMNMTTASLITGQKDLFVPKNSWESLLYLATILLPV